MKFEVSILGPRLTKFFVRSRTGLIPASFVGRQLGESDQPLAKCDTWFSVSRPKLECEPGGLTLAGI